MKALFIFENERKIFIIDNTVRNYLINLIHNIRSLFLSVASKSFRIDKFSVAVFRENFWNKPCDSKIVLQITFSEHFGEKRKAKFGTVARDIETFGVRKYTGRLIAVQLPTLRTRNIRIFKDFY